jgi:hypothetical protein
MLLPLAEAMGVARRQFADNGVQDAFNTSFEVLSKELAPQLVSLARRDINHLSCFVRLGSLGSIYRRTVVC